MVVDSARASDDYERVRRRALFRSVLAKLAGRANQLLSFEEVKQSLELGGPVYRGVRQVPIAQIVGSVDRYRDFDREFLPAQSRTADRWKSIARAFYEAIDLPPVRLYKVGDAYFVLDGHHRVSVARDQGQEFIDAEVQEAVSRVPVTADLKAEDLKVLHEYRHFLERTRLDEIRPDQRIRFTVAGGYDRLIEHIAMHRYFMGLELQRDVSEEEAVAHWYDTVYRPIVEEIRRENVLADFPGRTESDLYLWIVDHLYYLRETQQAVEIDEAAEDYAEQYSERPIRKLMRGVKHALGEPKPAEESPAYRDFMTRTRLDELRPDQSICATLDGAYDRLWEHIDRHRYYMGLDFHRDVGQEEAVTHWYDTVYMPIVNEIREHNLLADFPGRTETDLCLSIVAYLDRLRQQHGAVEVGEAAMDYVAQFSQHPIKKIIRGLEQALLALAGGDAAEEEPAEPTG